MRSAWLLLPFIVLTGCDSVVAKTGTDGEASTGTSGPSTSLSDTSPTTTPTTDTSPTTTPTTTGVDPSSTTDNPTTAASESSTGEFGSSSSTGGLFTGSTGSESSSGSSTTTDPTVGFIDTNDSVGDDECDPFLQDCAEGEKCNPWANDGGPNWNALDCFPVDPAMHQPGEACQVEESGVSGIDTCDVGSMCWDVDGETNIGTCVAMCQGSADAPTCADPSATCVMSNGGVLNLCLPGCDPLLQACPAGQGCYPIDASFVCAPDASGAVNGEPGDACASINACDPGTACITAAAFGPGCGVSCCSQFCDLSEPTCDLATQECVSWFEEGAAPPALANVGICSVPA